MSIRLLIVDDHWIVRDGLRLIFETDADFELVGEASDGSEALRLAAELQPDVILMDLRMPGMDGLTAIERLQAEQPQIAVVILTTYNEDELLLRGLRAGARGFLLKDTGRQALFDAVRAATRGETLLTQEMIARLLAQQAAPRQAAKTTLEKIALTAREQEVLAAVARGDRSKEIAHRLGITERTVKAHLASIYNKLGVDSRSAAVAVALQKRLIE